MMVRQRRKSLGEMAKTLERNLRGPPSLHLAMEGRVMYPRFLKAMRERIAREEVEPYGVVESLDL